MIIHANDNFLNALGYTLDEIKGKHHSMFVEPGYRASPEYKQFWDDLNAGNWQAVPGSVTIVGNQGCLTDATLTAGHRFYRVVSGN